MYHFLYSIHKKILKNTFDVTSNTDPKKEQIIDFCPVCNEQLEDRRVITLRRHEQDKHPKTEKEQLRDFYRKGSTQVVAVFLIVGICGGIFFPINHLQQLSWEDSLTAEEKEYLEFCKKLVDDMPPISIFTFEDKDHEYIARGNYIIENQKSFEKCHNSISYNSLGDKESKIKHFHSLEDDK